MLGRFVLGSLLFGVGMAVLGLCPGTTVAACGQGSKGAYAGVAGMLAGASAYVALLPTLEPWLESFGSLGKRPSRPP